MKFWVYHFMITFFFASLQAEEKRSKYFIAIKKNEGSILDSLDVYIPLIPPVGKYYADPFLCKHHGENFLFFGYSYSNSSGSSYT